MPAQRPAAAHTAPLPPPSTTGTTSRCSSRRIPIPDPRPYLKSRSEGELTLLSSRARSRRPPDHDGGDQLHEPSGQHGGAHAPWATVRDSEHGAQGSDADRGTE